MKKLILIFLFCVTFCSQALAVNWFVDMTLATGANDGTSTDDAWQSIKTGYEYAGYTAGDKCWIRRVSVWDEAVEATGASIVPGDDGTISAPIYMIGWPRASKSINCDWVNGSTTVDNVDGSPMDREQHVGRFIIGPDGFNYVITKIDDTNTFTIDREYAGSTSANEDVTIVEDNDYTEAQAIDDSSWTIKLSTWTADADDLPIIDFDDTAKALYISAAQYYSFRNTEYKQSSYPNGLITINQTDGAEFRNCLILQDSIYDSLGVVGFGSSVFIYNTIFTGDSGASSTNDGILMSDVGSVNIFDSAIYDFGGYGIVTNGGDSINFDNVNIGVEGDDGISEIRYYRCHTTIKGHDTKFGGSNGLIDLSGPYSPTNISFSNYGKVFGEQRQFFQGVIVDRVAVSGVTPNKKYSDYVLDLDCTIPGVGDSALNSDMGHRVYRYQVPQSVSKSYQYAIYNDTGQTLNSASATEEICLRCRYIANYDDDTEYVFSQWAYSTETSIADAADADDWDALTVSAFVPSVESNVECELIVSRNGGSDTGSIYVDPYMQNP